MGKGVAQDYLKAIELYEDAAAQDDVEAQLGLANLYDQGKGMTRDVQKAISIYERLIARHDDPRAEVNLGWAYETGKGVEKDETKAVELYRKAAAQGYPPGIAQLATCYAFGKGISLNYPKARELYAQAVASGDAYALNDFAWFLATCPEASERDGKQAVKLANRACEQSSWQNANDIGTLAAAYAEISDFSNAVKYQEQAVAMIKGDFPDPTQMKQMLALFRKHEPYREPRPGVVPTPAPQTPPADPKDVVAELEKKWANAIQLRDAKTVAALLTDDYTTTTPSGRVLNKAATVNRIEKDSDRYTSVSVDSLAFVSQEGQLVVTGILQQQGRHRRATFDRTFSFTDTWVKRAEGWLCSKSEVWVTNTSDNSIQGRTRH